MKSLILNAPLTLLLLVAAAPSPLRAQETAATAAAEEAPASFDEAAQRAREELTRASAELTAFRARLAEEKIPLNRELSELESRLIEVREVNQATRRDLDGRLLELANLRNEIKTREDEAVYLSDLLAQYVRSFESRLHIAEVQRYEAPLEAAKLAMENDTLAPQEVYATQIAVVRTALERLEDALGGTRFEGTAVDQGGLLKSGTFVLLGPSAVFRAADGSEVGTAEQRLGSLEPSVVPFATPEDAEAAGLLASTGAGEFPLDPTLGNAHKFEATNETQLDEIKKGGAVMIPIFAMAGIALLLAIYKWLALTFTRKPSRRRVRELLTAVENGDEDAARAAVRRIRGPVGRMLAAGVEHMREPRELIEEVMYETILTTRLRAQSLLPFIAICAASAPLLGLLGTVTGIITTFKLITVFGSGDVKSLSGGISEALITTKFGLIVAIPSLLLHAFLSRKAKSVTDLMERTAMAFVNQVSLTPHAPAARAGGPTLAGTPAAADPKVVREQVNEILNDLLVPKESKSGSGDVARAGS